MFARPTTVALLVALKLGVLVAVAAALGGAEQLCQFDCLWYLHTAAHGYDLAPRLVEADATNRAFFPLFPLLTRLGMATGLPALWSALAVASLALFAGLLAALRYRAATRPGRDPARFAVALLLFPYGLYLSLPYTESLYFALTMLLLLAYQHGAQTRAGVASALLTATRPTGILLVPYLVVETLWRRRALFGRRVPGRWPALVDTLFPLALMPLGLALVMATMAWLTGDAFASTHAQVSWGRHFENPLRTIYWNLAVGDWSILLRQAGPDSRSYEVAWVIPAALGCAWLLWRRLGFEAWILGITTLIAISAGAESVPRYVGANPVFLLLAGDIADRVRPSWARWALGALCLVLQAIMLHRWLLGSRMMM